MEIFLAKQLRALGSTSFNPPFNERLKSCLIAVQSCQNEIPSCVLNIINLLLQPQIRDLKNFNYPAVTDLGLPPPSAHLLLEPLLHCVIPFPKSFQSLYKIIAELKEFKNVAYELEVLYHFDCDGTLCEEYETVERLFSFFALKISK